MPWVKVSGEFGFMVRKMKGLWEMMGFEIRFSFFST